MLTTDIPMDFSLSTLHGIHYLTGIISFAFLSHKRALGSTTNYYNTITTCNSGMRRQYVSSSATRPGAAFSAVQAGFVYTQHATRLDRIITLFPNTGATAVVFSSLKCCPNVGTVQICAASVKRLEDVVAPRWCNSHTPTEQFFQIDELNSFNLQTF